MFDVGASVNGGNSTANDLLYSRLFSEMSATSRLDVIVFGASGYTGQYVVEEMARKGQQFGLKWGVAGRTVEKLKQILQQASSVTGTDRFSLSTGMNFSLMFLRIRYC